MKARTIKSLFGVSGKIQVGTLLNVGNLKNGIYEIVDGEYKGSFVFEKDVEKVVAEFTFEEVKAIESVHLAKLDIERAAKERAQELVKGLTGTLNQKNHEIETLNFCINILAGSLKASCEAIHKLRDLEKAQ